MSELLRHPLIVALVGAAIAGGFVQVITQRWQQRQKTLDVRVSLVADMSEAAMGLMALFETSLNLEAADAPGASAALDDVNAAERQKFEVLKSVVGTKLEAYLKSSTEEEKGRYTIADRWDWLAEAMTNLIALRQQDAANDPTHREERLNELTTAMTELVSRERSGATRNGTNREEVLQKVRSKLEKLHTVQVDGRTVQVDGLAWLDVHRAVLERKRVLIVEVLDAPTVF